MCPRSGRCGVLSLHGLVRHMAETERNWFSRILENKPDLGRIWYDPAVEGSPLVPLDHANWEEDLATYQDQCDHSRQEYARRNGHADMIRQLLDGATGL
jgi:Protein of unknown function (DUF664)